MKIEINPTEKTIKILEDISTKELLSLVNSINNFEEYKLIQSKEIIYVQQPTFYPTYYPTNPYTPIWTTSTGSNITVTTTGSTGTNSFYTQNID